MKFYEVGEPFYALIKAKSYENAIKIYEEDVLAEDTVDIEFDLDTVTKTYTKEKMGLAIDDSGYYMDYVEVLEVIDSDREELLLIDGGLI